MPLLTLCTITPKGLKTYFLMFENGARLEIMSRPDITENAPQQSLGIIHIAFSVKTKTDVDTLTNRLAKDGYTILSAPEPQATATTSHACLTLTATSWK
ncbi:catechol-2 [Elusimicrobium simillimum]